MDPTKPTRGENNTTQCRKLKKIGSMDPTKNNKGSNNTTIEKDEPHRQERLNSSMGPWEKQCNGTPTYTISLVNKTINV